MTSVKSQTGFILSDLFYSFLDSTRLSKRASIIWMIIALIGFTILCFALSLEPKIA